MTEYIGWLDEDHAPVVDMAQEVVRCRDCEHYTDDDMEYYHYCGNWCEQVEPEGFCAWAKRREQ